MNNLQQNITKLIENTKSGKVKWEKVNPTTFNWVSTTSGGEEINVILLKKGLRDKDMLFRLWSITERRSILDIQYNNTDAETKELLEELYKAASGVNPFVEDIFSDILRDL